ncbi:hypothetical protein L596_011698 [Steinernema carpocapsae]|uniref:Cysteine dioxygenase n=1 Tax=Steinernema carpocapsae TaxID=34508 RepID=A0A4U5NUR7_STECR|nr:hypothetical protein L596_011698 [Steinernema carpocapsae]
MDSVLVTTAKADEQEMLRQFLRRCSDLCPTHDLSRTTQKKLVTELKTLDIARCSFQLPKKVELRTPAYSSEVFQNERIHCCIFGFRKRNDFLPFHDHPEMYGFIRALRGKIRIEAHSWMNNEDLTVRCEASMVLEGDKVAVVGPHIGNVHQITALTDDAAFFDLLVPGYVGNRDCNYYRERERSRKDGTCQLEEIYVDYGFMAAHTGNQILRI